MKIFIKIPAWHSREEQVIEQEYLKEIPNLKEKDLIKVESRLWQWHYIEYDFSIPSATIVLNTYPEKTKEEELAERAYPSREEEYEMPNGQKIVLRNKGF